MNESQARQRARELWGEDTLTDGRPARSYGEVRDDGTSFGQRFKVGRWVRHSESVGFFEALGESSSWVGAFADAERRAKSNPRT